MMMTMMTLDLKLILKELLKSVLSSIQAEIEKSKDEKISHKFAKLSPTTKEKLTWLAFNKVFGQAMDSFEKLILGEALDILPQLRLSRSCTITLFKALNAIKHQKSWIFKMIDATGRPFSAGLMDGTITDFGSFDQCIGLELPLKIKPSGSIVEVDDSRVSFEQNLGQSIRGQYCMVTYNIYLPPRPEHLNLQSRIFNFTNTPIEGTFLEEIAELIHVCYERVGRVGVCIPSSCSKDDFEQIIDYSLKGIHMHANVSHCEVEKGYEFNRLQSIILGVFGFLGFSSLVGTLFDLIINPIINKKSLDDGKKSSFTCLLKPNSCIHSILMSFSILRNLSSLMETRTKQGSLNAINGIRVLSMSWIVYTHTYLIPIKETFAFARSYIFAVQSFLFQFILNGWVLVDTFFCIGALLLVYTTLGSLHRTGRINVCELFLNRIARFFPSVLSTLALLFLIPSLGTGPLWSEYFNYQLDKCSNYWWATLLFVNNWFPEAKICMLHTWYISADMQLYIVGIALLIAFYKFGKRSLWLAYATISISMLSVFLRTYLQSAAPTVIYNSPSEVITDGAALSIYTPTYIHLGPYCVGLIAGFFIYYKKNVNLSWPVTFTCWALSMAGLFTILFYTYTWNIGDQWTPLSAGFYATFHRTCWSICISWVIFACVSGYGGIIASFLSWKGFFPLAKLSFSIYLLHFPILWWRYAYLRERLAFGHYTMLCEFIVNLTLSTFAALLSHILVEAPTSNLYRAFVKSKLNWATIKLKRKSVKVPDPADLDFKESFK
uniref:Nose resistant-to-fluoxetine protein N-terminal domain-containing protein n=1 Tax=Tetranychus urticae TaxID=32264 RepID=T1KJ36_TETUR